MKDRTEKADMSPEGSTSEKDGLKWLGACAVGSE